MKCPKCGYLGFEDVDRCRNCGYDFSLSQSLPAPELPIREEPKTSDPPGELPLFVQPIPDDDRPLITQPSLPRQPLSVRRAPREIPRIRPEPARPSSFDLDLDISEPLPPFMPEARVRDDVHVADTKHHHDASVGARLVAVAIDLLILAVIDVLVVYLTLQICGISLDEFAIVPKGPLLAFLLVQNGGYLVAFTAGGQTLGKMAAGIRVISTDEATSLDLARSFVRTFMWFVLAVPAGLGFLTAVFSRDHRGLHDRFAHTRVVR
jgi:uncharacterized RDD family membrane protein YckC